MTGMTESPTANTELLVRLMNKAESGPMMQWFIMIALENFAEQVIATGAQGLDNPLISPDDLLACAREAKEVMEEEWQF